MSIRCRLDEHQEGLLLPISDLGIKANICQGMDQVLKLGFRLWSICATESDARLTASGQLGILTGVRKTI